MKIYCYESEIETIENHSQLVKLNYDHQLIMERLGTTDIFSIEFHKQNNSDFISTEFFDNLDAIVSIYDTLESCVKADQENKYFTERNELYIRRDIIYVYNESSISSHVNLRVVECCYDSSLKYLIDETEDEDYLVDKETTIAALKQEQLPPAKLRSLIKIVKSTD